METITKNKININKIVNNNNPMIIDKEEEIDDDYKKEYNYIHNNT